MVTLKDIARAAGVSPTAVSRTIRGQGNYSQECRDRIMQLVDEMGYRPNLNARALVKQQSDIFGLIVPDASVPFFGRMFKGAHLALVGSEHKLMMSAYYNDQLSLEQSISSLLDVGCQNIILHSLNTDEAYLKQLANKVPGLVIIGRLVPSLIERCVWIDNHYGGHLAANYLIEKDHKNIAVVSSSHVQVDANERLAGVKSALQVKGLTLPEENIVYVQGNNDTDSQGGLGITELLKNNIDFTAVLTFNDRIAIDVAQALTAAGKSIPDDISLLGFDDSIYCNLLNPKLSSVKYPIQEMAAYAVQLSLKLSPKEAVNNEVTLSETHHSNVFTPEVVARDSVKKKPSN